MTPALPGSFPPAQWRLLITSPAAGAWNMAVDEAILKAVGQGLSLPTLRLFAWEPACLSLGYAQPSSDVDKGRLTERGWHLVRRPTGGRAILHTDELTYSVIGPLNDPRLAGSVLDSYRCLATALLDSLHRLNIPAESNPSPATPSSAPKGPVCFEVPSNYEITVAGKKLIGSAQARRKEGFLQHGTLPLSGDLTRITQVLAFPNEVSRQDAANRLLSRATTVELVLGAPITWQAAADAFVASFESILNLSLVPQGLTPQELSWTETIVTEKFAHPSWTERGG
jgi:lipoate-protein ligase A